MPQCSTDGLTLRQERFVSAYLLEPNATQAAIAAGYSAKSAGARGAVLLAMPAVKTALAQRSERSLAKVDASVGRIVRELAAIGFSDVTQIFEDSEAGLRIRPLAQWPAEMRACVSTIKTRRVVVEDKIRNVKDPGEGEDQLVHEETFEVVTEIKLHSKVEALKLLAVYRKMVGGGDQIPADQRQQFVGLAITVAPGAQANIQVVEKT